MTTQQAPAGLELVRAFANTVDVEGDTDALSSPQELASWLDEHHLGSGVADVDAADLELALDARLGLRALIAANHHEAPDRDALGRLDRVVDEARLAPRFAPREARLEPGVSGVAGALGRLLAIVATAMADGNFDRLKLCLDDGCAWAFYDQSRNRSGRWCSMAVCGNRSKARTYRSRHTD